MEVEPLEVYAQHLGQLHQGHSHAELHTHTKLRVIRTLNLLKLRTVAACARQRQPEKQAQDVDHVGRRART